MDVRSGLILIDLDRNMILDHKINKVIEDLQAKIEEGTR
jgi:hypothetical protein